MAQSKKKSSKSRIADSYIQALVVFDGMADDIAKQFKDGFEEGQKKTEPVADEAGKKSGGKFALGMVGAIAASGAAAKIGEMFGDAINNSFDQLNVNSTLGASLALNDADLKKVTDVAKKLKTDSYGDTYEEVANTMRGIVSTVKGAREMSGDELFKMGRDVINVGKVWDLSSDEITTAASAMVNNGMAENFGDAVSLIAGGFQTLGGHGADLLDTVNEFGGDFARFGLKGAKAINFLQAAIQAGVKDTDKLGDSLNEMSITIRSGDIDEQIKAIGLDPKQLRERIDGTYDEAKGALVDVLERIQKDGNVSMFAKFLGSLGEDYKDAFQNMDLSKINDPLGETVGKLDVINDQLHSGGQEALSDFKNMFEQAFVDLVVPILLQITPMLEDMIKFFKENAGAVRAVAIAVGVLLVAGIVLATFALIGMAAAGWAAVAPLLIAAGPFILIIAAVGAAVAAFWWMSDQFGGVTNMMSAAWKAFVDGVFQMWTDIQNIFGHIGDFLGSTFTVDANVKASSIDTGLPMMADGGTVQARPGGTAAILGEAGKAEVVMDQGKWNSVLDKINSGDIGGQGAGSVTFNISTRDNESAEDILAKITDHLDFIGMR